ncbi:hypothetical protein EW026_g3274 [Hermanssonia centrifuga]|uniref:Protein BCP1 n=1 Tax=Hermanssonia centrifuga TaxID=98765 RepID=A0A4S4KQ97_9APHY|nr:hypothetical protein EW026_g3274 [Hermanssonia centrifuga]
MSKRKQGNVEGEGDDSDVSLVDVDFEFFDPNPTVDYLALKRLAVQLFQGDAEALQLHDLADWVLSQPQVGTTIKCDGKESDPYAFLTVLNLHVYQDRPFAKALVAYILNKSPSNPNTHSALQALLGPAGLQSQNHVGFVFSERLVNMPVQLMPPMYRMLSEELQWATDDNKPFRFSHYLFVSQTYRLSPEDLAELDSGASRSKRHKGSSAPSHSGVQLMHAEDEYIQQFASHTLDYAYSSAEPRNKESFGLDTACRLMLVPAENFPQLIAAIAEAFPAPE